jgi:hypothetical protein
MSRAPTITRANTSRPSWSVPNQCVASGGVSEFSGSDAYGSCGTTKCPTSAHATQKSRISAPMTKVGERRSAVERSKRGVFSAEDGTLLIANPSLRFPHWDSFTRRRGLSTT